MTTAVVFVIGVLVCVQGVLGADLRSGAQQQGGGGRFGYDIYTEAAEKVKFKLFTRQNPEDPEVATMACLPLDFSYLDSSRPTKILVHGWRGRLERPLAIKDAFLAVADVNVFVVDWKDLDSILYPVAVMRIKPIAHQVGTFVNFLRRRAGIATENVHLVGHSLGAHIAGLSSESLLDHATFGRITGLDPAGPMIMDNSDHRLDKTHASFVDVIHTCCNVFGYNHPLGHVDFFPNGGTCSQPGCSILDLTTGKCSHNRAYYLFRETILKGDSLMGLPALTQSEETVPSCERVNKAAQSMPMGFATPSSARGQYCLLTRSSEPFGYDWESDEANVRDRTDANHTHIWRAFQATSA